MAGQKSGIIHALDPDREGTVLWQHRTGKGSIFGGVEFGLAVDEQFAYVPNSDVVYGPTEAGGLLALKLTDGEEVWHARPPIPKCDVESSPTRSVPPICIPAQSAAVTVIPGVVFSGATDGTMRAYSVADGHVLWEYNTVREYQTVNGVPAKGGSINGPGPTVAGGTLFVNSGYAYIGGGVAGNVLLAFRAE